MLDLAYQDWTRRRTAYFDESALAPTPSAASLRRLDVVLVNMDRAMRDFMLVAAQRADFDADARSAAEAPRQPTLTQVVTS